jgi:hypothetical protein
VQHFVLLAAGNESQASHCQEDFNALCDHRYRAALMSENSLIFKSITTATLISTSERKEEKPHGVSHRPT